MYVGQIFPAACSISNAFILACDGSAFTDADYPALAAALGTTWGAKPDPTHTLLPDLRGRAVSGNGTGPGLSARTLGVLYGVEEDNLSVGQLPPHTHTAKWPNNQNFEQVVVTPEAGSTDQATYTDEPTSSVGNGDPFPVIQPTAVIIWYIKALP